MRLYTFVNFYLSSIQQGIQSAHVVHSLFVKYPTPESNPILWEWARNHRTMIVLNGGTNFDVRDGFKLVSDLNLQLNDMKLPFESFSEDDLSLGGVMTSFGIVVPEQIFNAQLDPISGEYVFEVGDPDSIYFNRIFYKPGQAEHTFLTHLKSCGLAR